MNETGKRKEWIKNIAIIFLTILLILTFFSNTIKNYSLPEVAAQYTYSASITNKVRGSGTVDASDPYSVVFKAERKVASVAVRVGDEVNKGDVIYVLEEGESEELKAARQVLEQLETAYEKGLVLGQISNELTDKVENGDMGTAKELQEKLNAAKKKVDNAKAYLETLQREQATAGSQNNSANAELDKQIKDMDNLIGTLEDNRGTLKTAMTDAEKAYLEVVKYDRDVTDNPKKDDVITTLLAYLLKIKTLSLNSDEMSKTVNMIYKLEEEELSLQLVREVISFVETTCKNHSLETLLTDDTLEYTDKETAPTTHKPGSFNDNIKNNNLLIQKQKEFDQAQINYYNNETNIANCKKQIEIWKSQKTSNTTDYETKISNAQAALEKAEKAYNDLVSDITSAFDLIDQLDKIEDQKKEIEKLEKEQGSIEITAPVSGTIVSMNYVAGEMIEQGSTVSTIQIAGKGYTLSFSIPTEKARLISVGDEAEITNSWWYSDVHARIMTIRPDPSNPSQSKLVTMELEGDVTAGQSLSFSVGKKSANYDIIVPNSAIHEDNKGKFIYRINSKSTPLGNRYIIERIDVTVLASDDNQSAISGALEGWDYVVTTSSKPIEDGTEVRLKD